jgi:hypothetical protein
MSNLRYVFLGVLCFCCSACTGSSSGGDGGDDTGAGSQRLDSGTDSQISRGDAGLITDAQGSLDTAIMDATMDATVARP